MGGGLGVFLYSSRSVPPPSETYGVIAVTRLVQFSQMGPLFFTSTVLEMMWLSSLLYGLMQLLPVISPMNGSPSLLAQLTLPHWVHRSEYGRPAGGGDSDI